MRSKRAIVLLLLLLSTIGMSPASADDPRTMGRWLGPFSERGLFDERPPQSREEAAILPTAVSIAVLPDGRLLYWNGLEAWEEAEIHVGLEAPTAKDRTRILDVRALSRGQAVRPSWTIPSQERAIGVNLFCSDLRTLADGRVMAVGGTDYTNDEWAPGVPFTHTEFRAVNDTRIFDPRTGRWTFASPMTYARWYPSLISLPGGQMLVAGGAKKAVVNERLEYVNETETFDPSTGSWSDNGEAGKTALPYYARLHLLPNGKVFYDASGQMWGPFGSTTDMAEWNKQKLYDPRTRSWSDAGVAPFGGRSGTFSVMLPLKAPYDSAQVLIAGGTLAPATPGTYAGLPLTEIVTADRSGLKREVGPFMNNGRWHAGGVVLPSGEVVAINGGDRDDTVNGGTTTAIREAELFDGTKWTRLAPSARDRVYHHTSVLLGDGSVLVGGHAPLGLGPVANPGDDHTKGAFAPTLRDPSFEIFQPPYLFRGARPRLQGVQAGIARGQRFAIQSPDARKITKVVLSRLPSVTHLADVDQRTIELPFRRTGHHSLTATVPADPAVALDGHYYLFLMTDNGKGPTPSRAAIVEVGRTDLSPALQPFGM